jgi:hypothetical protein
MKTIPLVARMLLLLFIVTGCEPQGTKLSSGAGSGSGRLAQYGPVKVDVMPLTEFAALANDETPSTIKAYVSLLDAFDCQIKAPAVFRFELYEKVPRSAEPRGRRILLWPDIDLTDAVKNNGCWNDFLRAYEFNLPFESKHNQSCILQVTALCPDGKRISADFTLK